MSGCVYNTNREWFEYIRASGIENGVNFGRVSTSGFRMIEPGEFLWFRVNMENRKRKILGYGTYEKYEVLTVNEAWQKYGEGNGAASERDILEILKQSVFGEGLDLLAEIGCIILNDVHCLENDEAIDLDNLGIYFPRNLPGGMAVDDEPMKELIGVAIRPSRNPPWAIDELILALDLYFKLPSFPSDENHPEVIALSQILNRLPIHPKSRRQEDFRNPNSVYMKLCNFLRLDPSYSGKGLDAGSRLDEEVWDRFYNDREGLMTTAEIIRTKHQRITPPKAQTDDAQPVDKDEEFPEGKIIRRLHTFKERSSDAPRKKKRQVLQETGRLVCEACRFDFVKYYGEVGRGFAECHHIRPLEELLKEERTKLEDLAIVCANCHRMLHRIRPWLTIQQLHDNLEARSMLFE